MVKAIFLRKTPRILGKLAGAAVVGVTLTIAPPLPTVAKDVGAEAPGKPRYGRSTGLPLPRFASVKRDPARLRRGPGVDYPILWEITRRGLPVRIIGEYAHWRRVELHDGSRGWMHRVLLSGRRTAVLLGDAAVIRAEPYKAAAPVAEIGAATPLRLDDCVRGWCALEAPGLRGWAPQSLVWGADASRSAPRR